MLFIGGEENALAPGTTELHLDFEDAVTLIMADGAEVYVYGDGTVYNSYYQEMKNA